MDIEGKFLGDTPGLDMDDMCNRGYNVCDKCGIILRWEDLYWFDYDDPDPNDLRLVEYGGERDLLAVCDVCLAEIKNEIGFE